MRIAVITAIAGGKDILLRVPENIKSSEVDFIAFREPRTKIPRNSGWDRLIELPQWSDDNKYWARRNAKLPKILPGLLLEGPYDYTIWMDGTHMPCVSPRQIIEECVPKGAEITTFRHGKHDRGHDCIYKEAENIKNIGFLEDPEVINRQVAYYKVQGFPEEFGLSCNTVTIWKNTFDMFTLSLSWWEQICRFSSRDQMSLFYCHWMHGTKDKHGYLPGHWERNDIIPLVNPHVDPRK